MWTMSNEIRELVTNETVSLDSRSDDNQKFNFNRKQSFVTKLKNQGKLKLKAPSDSMWTMSNEIGELVTSKTVSFDSRSDYTYSRN